MSRRILIDPDRWLTGPRAEIDLDVLHTAVFADRRLRIRYRHGGSPEQHTYTVDPYGLVSKAGVWYLVADRQRRPALFRADRIGAARLVEAPVRRRPGVELADVWDTLRRRVEERPRAAEVTVRVHRTRFDMFARIVGPMFAEAPDTGVEGEWITVRVAYPVLPAAGQLLQFGTSVEVLGPPEARQEMARRAAAITALYETGELPRIAPLYDGWE